MNRNLSVAQLSDDHTDGSYTTLVDYDQATRLGADKLGGVRVGKSYYYKADETDEVYRLTRREVAEYGAGLIDERGVNYSLWCSSTGEIVKSTSPAVRQALGID